MKRKKLYEVEINRYFKNVSTFWSYAVKMCEKHGVNLTDWIENLEYFCEPLQNSDFRDDHKDWDEPLTEVCRIKPYDYQVFLQNNYNFIMEFDFWDENSGHGYLYIVEYER